VNFTPNTLGSYGLSDDKLVEIGGSPLCIQFEFHRFTKSRQAMMNRYRCRLKYESPGKKSENEGNDRRIINKVFSEATGGGIARDNPTFYALFLFYLWNIKSDTMLHILTNAHKKRNSEKVEEMVFIS